MRSCTLLFPSVIPLSPSQWHRHTLYKSMRVITTCLQITPTTRSFYLASLYMNLGAVPHAWNFTRRPPKQKISCVKRPSGSDVRQTTYRLFLDLCGNGIGSQGGDLARRASGGDSGERGPWSYRRSREERSLCGCHMVACCPFSCRCGRWWHLELLREGLTFPEGLKQRC